MKRCLIIAMVMLFGAMQLNAQKVGYINSEKILEAIPAYKSAQTQLENLGNQYNSKIEGEYKKIETMYNNYQAQKAGLSAGARAQRENEIIQREKTVKELQQTYFGANGLMQQKSEELLNPIREKVDSAVKKVAENNNLMILLDIALMQGAAYVNSSYDLSNEVIKLLGY